MPWPNSIQSNPRSFISLSISPPSVCRSEFQQVEKEIIDLIADLVSAWRTVIPSRADGEGPHILGPDKLALHDGAIKFGVSPAQASRRVVVRSLAVCAARDDNVDRVLSHRLGNWRRLHLWRCTLRPFANRSPCGTQYQDRSNPV